MQLQSQEGWWHLSDNETRVNLAVPGKYHPETTLLLYWRSWSGAKDKSSFPSSRTTVASTLLSLSIYLPILRTAILQATDYGNQRRIHRQVGQNILRESKRLLLPYGPHEDIVEEAADLLDIAAVISALDDAEERLCGRGVREPMTVARRRFLSVGFSTKMPEQGPKQLTSPSWSGRGGDYQFQRS